MLEESKAKLMKDEKANTKYIKKHGEPEPLPPGSSSYEEIDTRINQYLDQIHEAQKTDEKIENLMEEHESYLKLLRCSRKEIECSVPSGKKQNFMSDVRCYFTHVSGGISKVRIYTKCLKCKILNVF